MKPEEIVTKWVEPFNRCDVESIMDLYSEDAINHQVANSLVKGKEAIDAMFAREFDQADMNCVIENIFEDGEWAILEWSDPLALHG